jgi:hypothetical protein
MHEVGKAATYLLLSLCRSEAVRRKQLAMQLGMMNEWTRITEDEHGLPVHPMVPDLRVLCRDNARAQHYLNAQ